MRLAQISPGDTGIHITGEEAYQTKITDDIGTYVGNYVLTPLFSVMGLVFFLLMIYSGVMWMTAAGNPDRVGKAKRILVSSVIGLTIVLFAVAITYWVVGAVNGVSTL